MRNFCKASGILSISTAILAFSGCDDGVSPEGAGGGGGGPASGPSELYAFESRFLSDESSVAYSGQTLRHVLIADLKAYIGGLDAAIESNPSFDATTVEAGLLSYYEFDSTVRGTDALLLTTEPPALQSVYDDLSSGKDLAGKIAGKDSGGEKDHVDWSIEFRGWNDPSIATHGGSTESPDGLVRAFLATIAHQVELQADGDASRAGLPPYVTPSGQDLQQLVEKFLLGAVAFSQAADDYLDEGLTEDNSEPAEEGASYTALEHAWDEAFGYFGAARDYAALDLEEIAGAAPRDSNEDGRIDLTAEYCFGASASAAKRDLGAATPTDLRGEAIAAFLEGRALIAGDEGLDQLPGLAKRAVLAWEKALAASVVHYLNEQAADLEALGSSEYSLVDHAKHWSEAKGFALSLQFNPDSPLDDATFEELHALLGDAPVIDGADDDAVESHREDLLAARALLAEAYGFADADVEGW
jgi:hypothetical protein